MQDNKKIQKSCNLCQKYRSIQAVQLVILIGVWETRKGICVLDSHTLLAIWLTWMYFSHCPRTWLVGRVCVSTGHAVAESNGWVAALPCWVCGLFWFCLIWKIFKYLESFAQFWGHNEKKNTKEKRCKDFWPFLQSSILWSILEGCFWKNLSRYYQLKLFCWPQLWALTLSSSFLIEVDVLSTKTKGHFSFTVMSCVCCLWVTTQFWVIKILFSINLDSDWKTLFLFASFLSFFFFFFTQSTSNVSKHSTRCFKKAAVLFWCHLM